MILILLVKSAEKYLLPIEILLGALITIKFKK